jgi:hypothetical protein
MRVNPVDQVGKFIVGKNQTSKFIASAETAQWALDLGCGEVFRGHGFDLTGIIQSLEMLSGVSHLIEFHDPIIPLAPVIKLTNIRIVLAS